MKRDTRPKKPVVFCSVLLRLGFFVCLFVFYICFQFDQYRKKHKAAKQRVRGNEPPQAC